jgi:hypothetical protein
MLQISSSRFSDWLLIVVVCLLGGAAADCARGQGAALKGRTFHVRDIKVTVLKEPGKATLPCMLWADAKGSALLALEGSTGVLRRIAFPSCRVTKRKDFEHKFTWMSLSAEGLLLSESDAEEVWVVDPVTLALKARIPCPG